ncbi:hypothetical protein ANAPRD1_01370 [Anaplasma phagocytophilum]|nr:hypothetical protein ANAPRD1_01370 [Anaplasma phagocytophilum]
MPLDLRAFFFVESKAMQKRVYNNTFRCHPFLQGKEAQSLFGKRKIKKDCRPHIRRDNPLNLSISLSGGKETNRDSLSSGERNGT